LDYEERNVWAELIVVPISMTIYVIALLQQAAVLPIAEIQWAPIMAWTVGASIIAMVLITVLWGTIAGIREPGDVGKHDQRDREISRVRDRAGVILIVVGAVVVIVLSAFEADWFWIANAMFFSFALSIIIGGAAAVIAYHRGYVL
jgi:hypothetical protein